MKLPLNWAQEYAKFTCTPREFADRMTMTGSKVEYYESEADHMQNVVVGRVAAIMSHVRWNSVVNRLVPVAGLRRMPSAIPIAAATPIAGAPRITMVLIALATSAAVRHVT